MVAGVPNFEDSLKTSREQSSKMLLNYSGRASILPISRALDLYGELLLLHSVPSLFANFLQLVLS